MIAGKRYHGLGSDIWSMGIILYAMTCGYLPFEDPNTSKLYKKILNTDPTKRLTIKDIRSHEWYTQIKSTEIDGIIVNKDRIPVLEEYLSKI